METVDLETTCRSYLDAPPGSKSPHSPNRNYSLKPLSQFPRWSLSPSGHLWAGSPERETQHTSLKAPAVLESQAKRKLHLKDSTTTGDHTWAPRGNRQAPHTPPPESLAPPAANRSLLTSPLPAKAPVRPRKETNASCCPALSTPLAKDSHAEQPEHRGGGCPLASLVRTSAFLDLGALSESQPHGTTARISAANFCFPSQSRTLLLAPGRSDL